MRAPVPHAIAVGAPEVCLEVSRLSTSLAAARSDSTAPHRFPLCLPDVRAQGALRRLAWQCEDIPVPCLSVTDHTDERDYLSFEQIASDKVVSSDVFPHPIEE
jgi:hypothetical protein